MRYLNLVIIERLNQEREETINPNQETQGKKYEFRQILKGN